MSPGSLVVNQIIILSLESSRTTELYPSSLKLIFFKLLISSPKEKVIVCDYTSRLGVRFFKNFP